MRDTTDTENVGFTGGASLNGSKRRPEQNGRKHVAGIQQGSGPDSSS